MEPRIVMNSGAPRIEGTRITVYNIMDYLRLGWDHSSIAITLRISSDQVLAATEYIAAHREEVERIYQEILERDARGNPPEVQEKLEAVRGSAARLRADLAGRKQLIACRREIS